MTPDGMDTKRSSATKSENKEVFSISHKNDIGHFSLAGLGNLVLVNFVLFPPVLSFT